ncbi:hypothetical protein EON63_08300 [archaeon]|nr:MAG: hypothetical protein EON63_08300 [archaeon]
MMLLLMLLPRSPLPVPEFLEKSGTAIVHSLCIIYLPFTSLYRSAMRAQVWFFVGCSLVTLLSIYGEAFYAPNSRLTHATTSSLSPLPLHQPRGRSERPDHALPPQYMVASATQSAAVGKAAYKAISKLLATCGIGVLASNYKILDQTALSVLSKLIFSVFQPCLLFVNVASTVANLGKNTSAGSPAAIYLLPLAALLQTLLGYVTGKLVAFLMYGRAGSESESAKQLQACTTFGNSGPLPLVFTDGLFRAHSNPLLLQQSVAYISLYLLGWSPLFWIAGPAILQRSSGGTSGGTTNVRDASEEAAKKRAELVKRIFSPPVVGSLMGMVVGFTPFLRKLITSPGGLLNPAYEAMRTLGAAYLPAVLLVLAGSLAASPTPSEVSAEGNKGGGNKGVRGLVLDILPIFIARFLLMPLLGFSLVSLGRRSSPWLDTLFAKDPMLLLVLLLETCMPR